MLLRDIRYAIRTLLSAPTFAIIAILSLAFGIGINSAMFSGAEALLLRPLRVPRAEEVVALNGSGPEVAKSHCCELFPARRAAASDPNQALREE